ncbi:HlyD family secretion protein [Acanthopleuribacter pedis]|uniref:Efflux RND transporter periplasmic adaptor subunit n=1 Tax=Acanthopleuribacter pedis TaxID=442870 RepID=A0A8J7Q9Q5_9BACT|nr:efflux RND transporter periplasmic adaptor subunit [Acanthopleuribacter pedis]MBO1321271.1 efflux RND transporter periplasmic adaptor subunit [Acanthopleuribacter pedis]
MTRQSPFRYLQSLPWPAILLLSLLHCTSPEVAETKPDYAAPRFHPNYEVRIPLTGRLQAQDATVYSSNIPAKTMKITWLVEEGRVVNAGEPLIHFDDSELTQEKRDLQLQHNNLIQERAKLGEEYALEQLNFQEALQQAEYDRRQIAKKLETFVKFSGPSKLKQLEQERHLHELKVRRLDNETTDLELLAKRGYITTFELDTHRENLLKAKYELEKAAFKHRTYQKHGMNDERIALEAEDQLAANKLEQLQTRLTLLKDQQAQRLARIDQRLAQLAGDISLRETYLDQCTVVSSHAGMVIYRKSFREGKEVKPSVGFGFRRAQPILNVQNTEQLFVATRINEFLLNQVKQGMAVELVADARQGRPFQGRVAFIGLLAERRGDDSEKAFDMNIEVLDAPADLRPGMSVRCAVITNRFEDIWTLPRTGLTERNNQTNCRVLRNGETIWLPVTVLDYDQQQAILNGDFNADDRVSLF